MKQIAGWFRRNSTLSGELKEARDSYAFLKRITATWQNECQDKVEEIALLEELIGALCECMETLIKARLALTNEPLRYECEQAIRKAKSHADTLKGE